MIRKYCPQQPCNAACRPRCLPHYRNYTVKVHCIVLLVAYSKPLFSNLFVKSIAFYQQVIPNVHVYPHHNSAQHQLVLFLCIRWLSDLF